MCELLNKSKMCIVEVPKELYELKIYYEDTSGI